MDRRTLLTGIGAAWAGGLAGCVSDGGRQDGGGTATGTPSPDEAASPGGTATETPTPTAPRLTDASLTVENVECGQQRNEASVAFEEAVVVTGTIWGSDTSRTAEIADASYDASADRLKLTVATTTRGESGSAVSAPCIVEIDYRATVRFGGGLPGTVEVVHGTGDRTETVATATPE